MKFIKNDKKEDMSQPFTYRCAAKGCPMRGTMQPNGSQFVCVFHYVTQSEVWPRTTENLHYNEKLRIAIDEVLGIGDTDWCMHKWEMMDRFFQNEPEFQPTVAERDHRRWYEYRLRNLLMHSVGAIQRKPLPREPLPVNKRIVHPESLAKLAEMRKKYAHKI